MTGSHDSLIPSGSGQSDSEKRDDLQLLAGGRGEFAGRNRSKRRYSIVISTSDHANSAGSFPGASLSLGGEACHGPECSESESGPLGRCKLQSYLTQNSGAVGAAGFPEIANSLEELAVEAELHYGDLEALEQRLTALEERLIAIF